MEGPEIHYVKRDGLNIGFQVTGEGPIDLLALNSGCNIWIDRNDEPHWSRFDRRLATFSRLIRFDPSGVGLSDPTVGSPASIESWSQDAVAVLDEIGVASARLFAVGTGGPVAITLAATSPERVHSLVLMHCYARMVRDADYPWGWPQEALDHFVAAVTDPTYVGDPIDDLALSAPSLSTDVEFRSWWQRSGERTASPAIARSMDLLAFRTDVRPLLNTIAAPTLVLHRRGNEFVRVAHSHYLAEKIKGAKLVELDGQDHLPFVGDTDAVIGEIEEFLTGSRSAPVADRILTTILFSDIVESTAIAVGSGDRSWRELLDGHDRMAMRQVLRFGGRQVKSTGDGILATFDSPTRAIHCGLAMCVGADELGMKVRVGVHTGEVERRGDDVAGIGVHISARVQECAVPGEVWVSRTVADLVSGSGIAFRDCGEHSLKGVPGTWQLFTAVS